MFSGARNRTHTFGVKKPAAKLKGKSVYRRKDVVIRDGKPVPRNGNNNNAGCGESWAGGLEELDHTVQMSRRAKKTPPPTHSTKEQLRRAAMSFTGQAASRRMSRGL